MKYAQSLEAHNDELLALLRRCEFRIYGAGVGTDELFRDLYAVTQKE